MELIACIYVHSLTVCQGHTLLATVATVRIKPLTLAGVLPVELSRLFHSMRSTWSTSTARGTRVWKPFGVLAKRQRVETVIKGVWKLDAVLSLRRRIPGRPSEKPGILCEEVCVHCFLSPPRLR